MSFTEIKNTQFMLTFFRKSWHLWHNVETYGRVGHVTDDNIIRRMHFGYWVNKLYEHRHDIQGVPGGMCQTSGECSLC